MILVTFRPHLQNARHKINFRKKNTNFALSPNYLINDSRREKKMPAHFPQPELFRVDPSRLFLARAAICIQFSSNTRTPKRRYLSLSLCPSHSSKKKEKKRKAVALAR